ncbi:hypothetical protein PFICI_05433 [Pestalotiopsis fici W106-1]|uniref:BZIP domain-containing protein n=1 Tax=Pestalotiopsis fici (strain W106-1 / CGMCC3.15140) TaxID=1229662 RepID=W3XDQ8_PESFW|nr:uncharacterized protein PFICI_05433 [Pestalotiopsis fici W106-1]ETS83557.1 hypothetical protein PFICI_05433 [Pestalotiopsis fici W106-1]
MPKTDEHNATSRSSKQPKPRQRVHKPPPVLEVPDINEDASERKRILNVLAQRRYRQRKRQKKLDPAAGNDDSSREESVGFEGAVQDPTQAASPHIVATRAGSYDASSSQAPSQYGEPSMAEFDMPPEWSTYSLSPASSDFLLAPGEEPASETNMPYSSGAYLPNVTGVATQSYNIDPNLYMDMSCPYMDEYSSRARAGEEAAPSYAFPESYPITMPELKVLQAFVQLATKLNCEGPVWHLRAPSSFGETANIPDVSGLSLPPVELTTKTGPSSSLVIEFPPWPSVRQRLIGVLPLPGELGSHLSADSGGPMDNLFYGVAGDSQGVRIWSHAPHDVYMHAYQLFSEEWKSDHDCQSVGQASSWRSTSDDGEIQ